MIIIGVDPGSRKAGYGILDTVEGGTLNTLAYDTLKASPTLSLHERLDRIYQGLVRVLERYKPDVMAVEEVFFARDVKSALALGQVRGVILLAGASFGLPIVSYSATFIKQAVSGSGRADKTQVQRMVTSILSLNSTPLADAADALAIAICHANSYRLKAYDRVTDRKNSSQRL